MGFKRWLMVVIVMGLSGCAVSPPAYQQQPAFYSYVFGDALGSSVDQAYQDDVYSTPASCQKVLTSLLAYKVLGENYRYQTQLWVSYRQDKIDDVIIRFGGDPTLRSEDLLKLLAPLDGIPISGEIILDTSHYQVPEYSDNIMIGDKGTSYARPISAMNLDENLLVLTLRPGRIGEPAVISGDISPAVVVKVTTSEAESAITLRSSDFTHILEGVIHVNAPPQEFKLSPLAVDDYVLTKLTRLLKIANMSGGVRIVNDRLALPTKQTLLNVVYSEPLATILPPALKQSDNFVFDNVYLTMLYAHDPTIQRWRDGDAVIKALLKQHFSLEMPQALFVDGSGLSRYNRIQAKQLFQLLQQAYPNQALLAALPAPGEAASTLENRTDLSAHIRAKTGNLLGVSCLCGYFLDAQHPKAFVVMVNGFAPPALELFPVLDHMVNRYVQ